MNMIPYSQQDIMAREAEQLLASGWAHEIAPPRGALRDAVTVSIAGATLPAQADPYRWCGVFGGGEASVTNCYFVTIEQCRASMSGNGSPRVGATRVRSAG